MKFGSIPLSGARGSILAHSIRTGGRTLRKGTILGLKDVEFLSQSGIDSVVAAKLAPTDLDENRAAQRIALALRSKGLKLSKPRTGRCNLVAQYDGLVQINKRLVDSLNRNNEAITVATVSPNTSIKKGDIAATVKIITFGVSEKSVSSCEKKIVANPPVILKRFKKLRIGLIQTTQSGTKKSLIQKAHQVTAQRIKALGSEFVHEIICEHSEDTVSRAITEMEKRRINVLLVLGASAITDRRDIVPQAVLIAKGRIEHFGMPVDPGNLLLLAEVRKMKILGIPGSARSPRLHGFDWILERLAAGLDVGSKDITAMGVGGLLKEIPTRPMPRKSDDTYPPIEGRDIAAIILAAGQSRRMGTRNKMLIEIEGKAMVRHSVEAIIGAGVQSVVVVTGYQPSKLKKALSNLSVKFAHNPLFNQGLSTSLQAGLKVLPSHIQGAIVMLGDMPSIQSRHIEQLISAFDPSKDRLICVPTSNGKRGNPVLWPKRFFPAIAEVSGDVGARHLIGEFSDFVVDVEMEDNAVIVDLDTPEAVDAYLQKRNQ